MKSPIAIFALSLLIAAPFAQGVCINTVGACGPGCWNEDNVVLSGNVRVCVAVGVGRYSPANDNQRYSCPAGTYSGISEAAACTPCEPGSFGGRSGLDECTLCPPSFYQDLSGQLFCRSCVVGYNGYGANAILDPNICHLAGPSEMPSMAPSPAPSSRPSKAPSQMPSARPSSSPSMVPSVTPSASPSSGPSAAPSTAPSETPSASPSITPSFAPSLEPSLAPSLFPSLVPSTYPSFEPSTVPSVAPSDVPSLTPTSEAVFDQALGLERNTCPVDQFALHGDCAKCPSLLRSIALALFFVLVVLSLVAFFVITTPYCSAVLFIGVEYFQVLSLVGITLVGWPRIMEIIFAFAALFGIDLDIIAPMQCHFGISPQGSNAIILMLPVLFGFIAVFCISLSFAFGRSSKKDLRHNLKHVLRVVCLGLFFGYQKLVLTSLEAVSCSTVQHLGENGVEGREIDWFCFGDGDRKDKVFALLGLLGVFVYGLGLPTYVGYLLYRYHDDVEESTGHIEDPTVLAEMAHLFLLPYRDDHWWWSAFVLARKFAYVNMVVFFRDAPILSLVFIAAVSLLSVAALWKESPYCQDKTDDEVRKIEEENEKISSRDNEHLTDEENEFKTGRKKTGFFKAFFRNQTVDLMLHGSIIFVVALGLLFVGLPDDSDARVGLGIMGLLVISPSLFYLVGAAIYRSRFRSGEKDSIGETDLAASIDVEGGHYEAEIPDSTSSYLISESADSQTHADDLSQMGSLAETESEVAPASMLHVETVGSTREWEENEQNAVDASNEDESDADDVDSSAQAERKTWGFRRMSSFAHA